MDELTKWLLEQAPVVSLMGIVIFWLQRRLVKAEDEKDKLSKDVIKLTTMWESKATSLGEDDKDFKERVIAILNEIKGMVK